MGALGANQYELEQFDEAQEGEDQIIATTIIDWHLNEDFSSQNSEKLISFIEWQLLVVNGKMVWENEPFPNEVFEFLGFQVIQQPGDTAGGTKEEEKLSYKEFITLAKMAEGKDSAKRNPKSTEA